MRFFYSNTSKVKHLHLSEKSHQSIETNLTEISDFPKISDLPELPNLLNKQMTLKIITPEEMVRSSPVLQANFQKIFYWIWKTYKNQLKSIPKVNSTYRKHNIIINLEKLKPWFPISNVHLEEEISFDSTTEELFFSKITGVSNLFSKVSRDAEIILVPDPAEKNYHVMIPDFQLHYHHKSLFIEIVGFWSEQYKSHKMKQLSLLSQNSPEWQQKLLLLIDNTLNFPKSPFPTFLYHKNQFPLKELESWIKNWEMPLYIKIKQQIIPYIISDLKNLSTQSQIITISDIQKKYNLESLEETRFLIEDCQKSLSLDAYFTKISSDVLVTKKKITQWLLWMKNLFEKRNFHSISKKKLITQLPEDLPGSLLDNILKIGNYKINYSDLLDIRIFPTPFKKTK
ncbi:MAG: DUF790 family protein [Promethearchaeota archaeon]